MRSKKGQGAVVDRTTAIVLAILVIILVVGIIFYLNPSFLYKLLPDYNTQSQTGDEVIPGADALTSICSNEGIIVGKIGTGSAKEVPIFIGGIKDAISTSLVYKKTSDPDVSELVIKSRLFDQVIGIVNTGKVSINEEYLSADSKLFIENSFSKNPFTLSVEDLARLDGSVLEGFYLFCRSKGEPVSSRYIPSTISPVTILLEEGKNLNKQTISRTFWFAKNYFSINLDPYVVCDSQYPSGTSCTKNFLYVVSKEGYFEVYLKSEESSPLFKISNDGFFWLDSSASLQEQRAENGQISYLYFTEPEYTPWLINSAREIKVSSVNDGEGYRKTSLKVDSIDKLTSFLKSD